MEPATLTPSNRRYTTEGPELTPNYDPDQIFRRILGDFDYLQVEQFNLENYVSEFNFNRNLISIIVKIENFGAFLESGAEVSFERHDAVNRWKRKIEMVVNSYFTRAPKVMTAYLGDDKFLVLLPADNRGDILKSHLKKYFRAIFGQLFYGAIDTITVGFSNVHFGAKGVVESGREADLALKLGSKLGGKNRSYGFEEFGILYTFAEGDLKKKVRVADDTLTEIEKSKKLEKTLKSFFRHNLSIAETADDLGVHRNTIAYRIRQIAFKTGLNPQIFDQAVIIKTALLIKKLA